MQAVKLLYIENVIFRKKKQLQQHLRFFLSLSDLDYHKQVEIIWAGENGVWQSLPAHFHSRLQPDQEYWSADIQCSLGKEQSLPGNIQCYVRYRVLGSEYLANHQGQNYHSEADSGIRLIQQQTLQNVNFAHQLRPQQQSIYVTVAVQQSFNAERVTLHWTVNNWKTTKKTPCKFKRNHWDRALQSHARNPNQYGVQLWSGKIRHAELAKLKYVICCDNGQQTLWDNNAGQNYTFLREQLKVLILNLHCYQETNQDAKLTTIANAINEQEVDIVCLQEVAEHWQDGHGDWESNAAKIINDRLSKPFYIHHDWSHLGFDQYREGVAILSRYPLSRHESRYVSKSHDVYDINSRKVVAARVHVPYIGFINVFSVHLSWLEGGFAQQFQQLKSWAAQNNHRDIQATLLCGDFNITAGSEGYEMVVDSQQYEDQYLAVNQQGVFDKIFKVHDAHWQDFLTDDYRIDYIFMHKHSQLKATSARIIFTEQDYGRVSDHCGYLMSFESL